MSTRLASASVSVLTAHRSTPQAAAGVGDGVGDGAGAGLGVAGTVGAGAVGDELLPHETAHSAKPNIHVRANFMSEPPGVRRSHALNVLRLARGVANVFTQRRNGAYPTRRCNFWV